MFVTVYRSLSCIGVRLRKIDVFITYDVWIIARILRSNITLYIYASDTQDTVIEFDRAHLPALRERNVNNRRHCTIGRPGKEVSYEGFEGRGWW